MGGHAEIFVLSIDSQCGYTRAQVSTASSERREGHLTPAQPRSCPGLPLAPSGPAPATSLGQGRSIARQHFHVSRSSAPCALRSTPSATSSPAPPLPPSRPSHRRSLATSSAEPRPSTAGAGQVLAGTDTVGAGVRSSLSSPSLAGPVAPPRRACTVISRQPRYSAVVLGRQCRRRFSIRLDTPSKRLPPVNLRLLSAERETCWTRCGRCRARSGRHT